MNVRVGPTAVPARPTAGLGTTASCADEYAYSRPYSTLIYKQKQYKSRCAFAKEQGHCSQSHYKSRCTKTCTGVGSDSSAYSRLFKGNVYQEKNFATRCAYVKEQGYCSASYYKPHCTKTCTGVGMDSREYSSPYKRRMPVVQGEQKYSSRCAYYQHRGFCSHSSLAERCLRTCGRCTASDKRRTGKPINICVRCCCV